MLVKTNSRSIAIVHRFFWPHTYPYAQMLKYIAEGVKVSGFDVSVYTAHERGTGQCEERARWGEKWGISVKSMVMPNERRFSIAMKCISAMRFSVWVFVSIVRSKAELVWVASTPPIVMPAVVRLARLFREFKLIYHCQDIHPESMAVNGNLSSGALFKLLRGIDKGNIDSSEAVVLLSRDMRDTVVARGCKGGNIHIVNNFVFGTDSARSLEDVRACDTRRTRTFLFAGSLGRFQNLDYLLDVFIEAAGLFDYKLIFMGDGPLYEALKNKTADASLSRISFLGQQPLSVALAAMDSADYGLVSLSPGVEKVAYPSKTIMYLSRGLPVVAFLPIDNELSEMLEDKGLGFVVDNTVSSVQEAAFRFHQALLSFESKTVNRADIRAFCATEFSKEAVVAKLVKVVSDTVNA